MSIAHDITTRQMVSQVTASIAIESPIEIEDGKGRTKVIAIASASIRNGIDSNADSSEQLRQRISILIPADGTFEHFIDGWGKIIAQRIKDSIRIEMTIIRGGIQAIFQRIISE